MQVDGCTRSSGQRASHAPDTHAHVVWLTSGTLTQIADVLLDDTSNNPTPQKKEQKKVQVDGCTRSSGQRASHADWCLVMVTLVSPSPSTSLRKKNDAPSPVPLHLKKKHTHLHPSTSLKKKERKRRKLKIIKKNERKRKKLKN